MSANYKNSYKVSEKELVSLSVYNVGFQKCTPGYQWGPGIRDHYLIHYIISGSGSYIVNGNTYTLSAGDAFLVYPNTEVTYIASHKSPWEYAWVGFTGSDASIDFEKPRIFPPARRSSIKILSENRSTGRSFIFMMPEAMN